MAEGEETEKPESKEGEGGEEEEEEDEPEPTFEEVFKKFAKYSDPESKDDRITLRNIDKWLKQANIKKISAADTAKAFKEVAKTKFVLSPEEFDEFLENVTKDKDITPKQVKKALTKSGSPVASPTWTPADALKMERCFKPPAPPLVLNRCGIPVPCATNSNPPDESKDKDKDKDKEKEGEGEEEPKEEPAAE